MGAMLASVIVWEVGTWIWGKGFEFKVLPLTLNMMITSAENALTMSAWGLQIVSRRELNQTTERYSCWSMKLSNKNYLYS